VTEIIFTIVGLLLQALRSLCIHLFMAGLERAIIRPRPSIPPVRRRRAFDAHPPSVWAAP
jgi:hypothetical protein